MYRDDMEALRARITTLDAQVNAEQLRREAAEADAVASRALLDEHLLASRQSGALAQRRPAHAWPVAMVVAVSTISCLYLGMQWSRQWHRSERLERQLLFLRHHRALFHRRARRTTIRPRVHTLRSADVEPGKATTMQSVYRRPVATMRAQPQTKPIPQVPCKRHRAAPRKL